MLKAVNELTVFAHGRPTVWFSQPRSLAQQNSNYLASGKAPDARLLISSIKGWWYVGGFEG